MNRSIFRAALRASAKVALGAAVAGCGGVVGSAAEHGEPEGSPSDAAVADATPEFCTTACQKTADDTCFSTATCTAYCQDKSGAWPPPVRGAFAACAAKNPLCYQTMDDCMLSALFPGGVAKSIQLRAQGFDANDGKVVHVWYDPGASTLFGGTATIAGGSFAFDWQKPVETLGTIGPLLLLYIDVDGNGLCDPSADLTGSQEGTWNADFVSPVWTVDLASPLVAAPFVCQSMP